MVDLVSYALPSAPGLPQQNHLLSCFLHPPHYSKFIVFDEHGRIFALFSYRPNQLPHISTFLVIVRAVHLSFILHDGTRFINRRRREMHTTSLNRNNNIHCQKIFTNPTRCFFSNFTHYKYFLLTDSEFWLYLVPNQRG